MQKKACNKKAKQQQNVFFSEDFSIVFHVIARFLNKRVLPAQSHHNILVQVHLIGGIVQLPQYRHKMLYVREGVLQCFDLRQRPIFVPVRGDQHAQRFEGAVQLCDPAPLQEVCDGPTSVRTRGDVEHVG